MFKGQQRYWVLIYQGVMYIYKDAKDKEPKERITLLGASLKKLKDKNKDGKGFMLQVGTKKEQTKYKIQNTKYKIQNTKYKIQNTKYKIHSSALST